VKPAAVTDLDSLGVFLVKRPNVEGVGGVDFATGRDQWRRIFLLIDLLPVHGHEERVLLQLHRSVE